VRLSDDEAPTETRLRFIGWLALGMLIYLVFGCRNSHLRRGEAAPES
jgi:hypothetical protein